MADVLTTLVSLSPADPVNMAGPSSATITELQERLEKLNKLAFEELGKGARCDKGLVAVLQREREILGAQINKQASGEIQMRSVLC